MNLYRVIGPPGTGKTQFIRATVEKWTEQDGIYRPDDFVLTSFTRTAASVLKGRVPVPRQNVATLHALGWRALDGPKVAEVRPLVDEWNDYVRTKNLPANWLINPRESDEDDQLLADEDVEASLFQEYNRFRALGSPPFHPLYERTKHFAKEWQAFKDDTGSVDFMDMIVLPLKQRLPCPVPARVLVVDEAQDLVPVQWTLVNQWGRGCERVIVAGDPAQVLYSWLGATPEPLLEPIEAGRQRLLSKSYRLPSVIRDFAENWLRRHSGPLAMGRNYLPRAEGGKVRWTHYSMHSFDLVGLVTEIEERLRTTEHRLMVLASCGYMLRELITALRHRGIPFHNPYRPSHRGWNPLGDKEHGALKRLLAFIKPGQSTPAWEADDIATFVDMLRATVFTERGLKKAVRERVVSASCPAEFFLHALNPVDAARAAALDVDWLVANSTEEYKRSLTYPVAVYKRWGRAGLDEPPRLVVGTIHSVKGGEADVVYVAPDISFRAWQHKQTCEGYDALVRVFYVAFTRAREELVLLQPVIPKLSMW